MTESPEVIQQRIQETRAQMLGKLHALEHRLSLRQQFRQHPWIALGASSVAGYLIAHWIHRARSAAESESNAEQSVSVASGEAGSRGLTAPENVQVASVAEPTLQHQDLPVHRTSTASPMWAEARSFAVDVLSRVIQRSLLQAVPQVIEHFTQTQQEQPAERRSSHPKVEAQRANTVRSPKGGVPR